MTTVAVCNWGAAATPPPILEPSERRCAKTDYPQDRVRAEMVPDRPCRTVVVRLGLYVAVAIGRERTNGRLCRNRTWLLCDEL